MNDKSELLQFTIKIAQNSGKILMDYYDKADLSFDSKGYNNIVTEADKAAEKYIIEEIKKNYPDHSILAEESGIHAQSKKHRWIIDPLDGTSNFAHKIPIFAVSIGLEIEGQLTIGVVNAPRLQELFYAEKGHGAYLNDEKISVSNRAEAENSMLATGFNPTLTLLERNLGLFGHFMKNGHLIRRLGAASIDLCYTACGRFDGFWEFDLAPWDMAAGTVIVEEAGGMVTKEDGSSFEVESKSIIASNGKMHERMVRLIGEIS